jgi:pyruvate kinase
VARATATDQQPGRAGTIQPITEGVVEAVRRVAKRLRPKLVVVATKSGRTALALSKQRYEPMTLALTDDPVVARSMALYWGVTPLLSPTITDHEKTAEFVSDWARRNDLATTGDYMVVVQGTMPRHPCHNSMTVLAIE